MSLLKHCPKWLGVQEAARVARESANRQKALAAERQAQADSKKRERAAKLEESKTAEATRQKAEEVKRRKMAQAKDTAEKERCTQQSLERELQAADKVDEQKRAHEATVKAKAKAEQKKTAGIKAEADRKRQVSAKCVDRSTLSYLGVRAFRFV